MKSNITSKIARSATIAASLMAITAIPAHAQQGDAKDKGNKPQVDPIPASEIPPSPLLNTKDAIKSMKLADGFNIQAIADKNINQPVSLAFDAKGRAWLVEMTQYMVDFDASDENKPNGVIKVLEDTTGDGNLDKVTVFMDDLILPRACAVTSDGLLYVSEDKLFFIKRGGDDGTTPVGEPELIDGEYAVGGNAEHKPNGLLLARDNWYYSAKSKFRYRKIEGKWHKQETNFRGQWGIAQDDAGRLFYNTNSVFLQSDQTRPNLFRQHPTYTPKHKIDSRLANNAVYPIRITPGINRAYRKNNLDKNGKITSCTAASGMTIYRGDQFPEEFQHVAFVTEPGPNLIKAIKIDRDEANKPIGKFVYDKKEFLASTDEWFRPVNAYTAPDGTLWFIDMAHGLIQHKTYMTTYLRKQSVSRNLQHKAKNNGRIFRVNHKKNKINKAPDLSKSSVSELYGYLGHTNGTIRDTAQRLLVEHITSAPEKLEEWKKVAVASDGNAHQQLHTLWVYEATCSAPESLILKRLQSKNSDVVNSALELAHLASSEKVNAAVIDFKATTKTAQSALFALAKIGTEDSNATAQKIIKEFKKVGETRALYIGALGKNLETVAKCKNTNDSGLKKALADAVKKTSQAVVKAPKVPKEFKASAERGKALYLGAAACSACHGNSGEGQGDVLPPVAPSNWVNTADKAIMAKIILKGLTGDIHVNGKKYATGQFMPARPDLNDQQIADLMVFIKHLKGNKGGVITADEVKAIREQTKDRTAAYIEADLMPAKK